MNFQNLSKIETSDKYIDFAFSAGKKVAEGLSDISARDNISKSKKIESERIAAVRNTLNSHLINILRSFPTIKDLPDFYKELVMITLDFRHLQKSMGAVSWALKKIDFFHVNYSTKIWRTREMSKINVYRREFYGRVGSVMKQIRNELVFLEESRVIIKNFPSIKTSLKSICILGFPNVGKSTLLAKITGAKPEIKNYAFTTKSLNLGTYMYNTRKYQFIDTPGTLNRFEKMNDIEKQSYLALKYCCDVLVFVFDMTEGYTLEDQYKLFDHFLKMKRGIPILVYLSKTDIVEKKPVAVFIEEFHQKYNYPVFQDKDALLKVVIDTIGSSANSD